MIEEIVSKLVEHFSKINFRRVKFFFFQGLGDHRSGGISEKC